MENNKPRAQAKAHLLQPLATNLLAILVKHVLTEHWLLKKIFSPTCCVKAKWCQNNSLEKQYVITTTCEICVCAKLAYNDIYHDIKH